MLLSLALCLTLQTGAPAPAVRTPLPDTGGATDTSAAPRDSSHAHHHVERPRIPVTPELAATAYHDPLARDLVTRARQARLLQDSSLVNYDAIAKQRMTVKLGFRSAALQRLLFRSEAATRVRWQQGSGVRIDVIGARTAFPMFFPGVRVLADMLDENAIPYFPGREGLFPLAGAPTVREVNDGYFIHPLDQGAEAYYQYQTGDSIIFHLPDGSRLRLREVTVIARRPEADLVVGSLWFDVATAHLVRAVFRPAATWDIKRYAEQDDPNAFKDVPGFVKPVIFPMTADIAAFTVEYGLHDQRWWLPRLQTVEGRARAGFTHISFTLEESFRYSSVNGTDSLPPIHVSVREDSLRRARALARFDSIRGPRLTMAPPENNAADADMRGLNCPRGDTLVQTRLRFHRMLPVAIHIPCDTVALLHSPELPGSIYSSGEETFDLAARDALVKELSLSLQPDWHPLPATIHYGLDRGLLRYNRIEGLSAGVSVDKTFGQGLTGEALARFGTADLWPNAELHVRRSDGRRTIGLGAYHRLNSASDWGDPFSFGSSVNALVFGRDDGFYYRSWGAELTGTRQSAGASTFTWRAFAERQGNAPVETNVSLANALGDHRFMANLEAAPATALGLGAEYRNAYGLDPRGLRLALDARGEGAGGTFDYARAALDATLSRGLGPWLDAALTTGAGYSAGHIPPQRLWYLGGPYTVRGQPPGAGVGDAYWLARAEVGHSFPAVRPILFFDLGWAGARANWAQPGHPMSGTGVGVSLLDGLVRFDVAKGIHPGHGWRVDSYLEGRF